MVVRTPLGTATEVGLVLSEERPTEAESLVIAIAIVSKRAAKESKRALPRKNCKQPGLKQPCLGPATTQNLVVKFDGEICGGVLVENASDDVPQQKKLKNLLPNFAGSSPPISPKTSPTSLWKSLVLTCLGTPKKGGGVRLAFSFPARCPF